LAAADDVLASMVAVELPLPVPLPLAERCRQYSRHSPFRRPGVEQWTSPSYPRGIRRRLVNASAAALPSPEVLAATSTLADELADAVPSLPVLVAVPASLQSR
jgi:hypothetical protein